MVPAERETEEPRAAPRDAQSFDEKRKSMLLRRSSSGSLFEESERRGAEMFDSRAVPLVVPGDIVSNPAVLPSDSSDPQRLFQLLRRKKKAPHALGVPTPLAPFTPAPGILTPPSAVPSPLASSPPNVTAPHHAPVAEPTPSASGAPSSPSGPPQPPSRPVFSARPFSPVDRPPTVSGRDVHSAQPVGINGRPFTRQKHPKKSLDLFPSQSQLQSAAADPFPKPQVAQRRNSSSKLGAVAPKSGVNFNCLFFKSEDELNGATDHFPQQHKPPVNIPLIETDWFSATSWEQLPTTDGAPQQHDEDLGPDSEEHAGAVYAEHLYELLVASKRRPLAR